MREQPRLLDLFCGAGGAARGYQRAGFYVVGVDIAPQPRYAGDEFIQGDALSFPLDGFDAIHASPPCQKFSSMTRGRWKDREHPDLVAPMRARLLATGLPFVIENVVGAPLINPITLCGSMFGLQSAHGNQLRRHRQFEIHPAALCLVQPCQHNDASPIGVYGGGQHPARRIVAYDARFEGVDFGVVERRRAMGIDWMSGHELNQAIPPAYTEYIGAQLIATLSERAA